jgi:hypothetical protein
VELFEKSVVHPRMNRSKIFTAFRNIRITPDGYQVIVTRAKMEFSKFFAGHTSKSLKAAEAYRNQLLKELPDKRINVIPRRVLKALGLSKPVVGVFRNPHKQYYAVMFVDKRGIRRSRSFPFRHVDEVSAYSASVKFRKLSSS